MYKKAIKRILDLFFALILLIILSPLLLILWILVRIKLGSPAIFSQERPGKDEKIFTIYKFRTMNEKKDADGELLPDEDRMTKFGNMLRRTSLDELPELINIIKGDMSFVGPRPLLVKYLPYYKKEEKSRHNVRPGLTGFSQIKGRNTLSWDKRFKMDIDYVNNVSFGFDITIMFMTLKKVMMKEDILAGNNHIMEDLNVERVGEIMKIQLLDKESIVNNKKKIKELLLDNLVLNLPDVKEYKKIVDGEFHDILDYIDNNSIIFLGAFNENEMIGLIWAYKKRFLNEDRIHLRDIAIDKNYRRHGIGKMMEQKLIEISKNNHIHIIELIATIENIDAINFYKNNGYTEKRIQYEKKI